VQSADQCRELLAEILGLFGNLRLLTQQALDLFDASCLDLFPGTSVRGRPIRLTAGLLPLCPGFLPASLEDLESLQGRALLTVQLSQLLS
jgi:hypothetical protein